MRIIQSPGVQITEKDLSLRAALPIGTNTLITGFAPQGPVNEPIVVTTVSELESVYGTPTTPAERYFYYSCREILNSPGVLTTVRLPYGADAGTEASNAHTALFYPMTSGWNPELQEIEWVIGTPVQAALNSNTYEAAKAGNFNWGGTSFGAEYTMDEDVGLEVITKLGLAEVTNDNPEEDEDGNPEPGIATIHAGIVILNDIQSVINEMSEGYYIGMADNLAALSSESPDFESITEIITLIDQDSLGTIPTTRLDFRLSATLLESNAGITSVSESLEKVGFVGFETAQYQDHVSLGVFKVRRSTVDPSKLTLGTSERFIGSLDYNRKQVSPSGGILANAFLEDIINTGSPSIKLFINPLISKTFEWTSHAVSNPIARFTVDKTARALYPLGTYAPDTRSAEDNKEIGSVPLKIDRALRTLEAIEDVQLDVIADGGLSTIFANTHTSNAKTYNDEQFLVDPSSDTLFQNWASVSTMFVNFAENIRKDCVAIIDPLRQTFVNGRDSKVIDLKDRTFSQDIYKPLRRQASLESNYSVMYGNWIKIMDMFTGRRFWFPFSGVAAGIFAKSDAKEQPWAAPAGLNRGGFTALDIAFNPNQKQRDRLYEISVNPVVFFNGDGYTVMGQKTLQVKPTAFDRINVRRLFLYLERAVQRTLKYFVFEPNTDFTRTRLVNVITPIFEYAKLTQGLYDYLIVADSRNNTPDTIDQNELIVDIYIKPVRTAEFILVNFIATRTGQNFQELI